MAGKLRPRVNPNILRPLWSKATGRFGSRERWRPSRTMNFCLNPIPDIASAAAFSASNATENWRENLHPASGGKLGELYIASAALADT